jgi:uncharacterized protein
MPCHPFGFKQTFQWLFGETMNLGFDIDGVISNFTIRFNEVIKQKYGITLTDSEMYSYEVNLVLGIPKVEVAEIVADTLKSDLPLNPHAKEILDRLTAEGHTIYLLTARSESLSHYTASWLKEKAIPYKELYHLVGGQKSLARVDVDVIVEDSLDEALELTKKVKHVLVYDQPWNKTKNVKGLLKRVHNWHEIYDEIQKLRSTDSK